MEIIKEFMTSDVGTFICMGLIFTILLHMFIYVIVCVSINTKKYNKLVRKLKTTQHTSLYNHYITIIKQMKRVVNTIGNEKGDTKYINLLIDSDIIRIFKKANKT